MQIIAIHNMMPHMFMRIHVQRLESIVSVFKFAFKDRIGMPLFMSS